MHKRSKILGILAVMLAVALVMPLTAGPVKLSAQGSDVYALVQLPNGATGEGLKAAVNTAFDVTGEWGKSYAVIGCTQAQLNSLVASGYVVIEQRSGDEEECLAYLFQKLDLLVPPRIGHYSIGGPDAFGYYLIDSNDTSPIAGPAYNWVEISGTGTLVNLNCDDCYRYPINIGFKFNFYGVNYTRASIGSNGQVWFQNKYLGYYNKPISDPTGDDVNTFIAVFWDDLNVGSTYSRGQVYYQTLPPSGPMGGDRRFVVQYDNVPRHSNSGAAAFEVILYEGSNEMLMQYKDVDFGRSWCNWGKSATVGIQQNSRNGLMYSYDSPVIKDGLAILFTPRHPKKSPLLGGGDKEPQLPLWRRWW